ncbi:MAG: HAD-IB family hydrolase [Myxococcota bacterium]
MSEALDTALDAIARAARGPEVAAFFDLDGTLVRGYTAVAFLKDQLRRGELGARELLRIGSDAIRHHRDPSMGLGPITSGVELLRGRKLVDLEAQAEKVFRNEVARRIRKEARALVQAHQGAGHTVVMATAATRFQAGSVARDLGMDHVLCTEVEVVDGVLTGKLAGPARWGAEKAAGVIGYTEEHGLDRSRCFAYGNGVEDEDFLASVGNPVAVRPDPGLEAIARKKGILVLDLEEPREPGLRGLAGTVGAFGVFNAGLFATLAASAVMDKREARAVGGSSTADLALIAAGVHLDVRGLEHVEAARPAVILFNHQSNLDALIVGAIVRRDFTAVAKIEAGRDPRSFALRYLDIALIDRSDAESARKSVAALAERIRGGESVIIAPEGTRMPTPTLGRFKQGGFRLAMDAGVPLLPIVLRNTGELWPRGAAFVRPGTAEARVLPPIPTTDWTLDTLPERIAGVRQRFEDALESWEA